jgi:hypothetical protein
LSRHFPLPVYHSERFPRFLKQSGDKNYAAKFRLKETAMRDVTQIVSKKFFGKYYYGSTEKETMSRRTMFRTGVALNAVLLPFYLSMGDYRLQLGALMIEVTGALLGYIMFKIGRDDFTRCVPVTRFPGIQSGESQARSKKAA